MYGFIYITTNHINGKKYIGQRKYDKQGKWKKYLGSGIILSKAIKKYGIENFSKEIIEDCETKQLLNLREKYWIDYYNAADSDNFYNIANGGDGGNTIAGYTKEQLEKYKEYKSELHKITAIKGENASWSKLTENEVQEIIQLLLDNVYASDIAKKYNVKNSTIDDIYFHRSWSDLTKNIIFPSRKNNRARCGKKVIQYDLEMNYINEYESAHEAERKTGIGFRMISRVCNGNRPYTHGYIFQYA